MKRKNNKKKNEKLSIKFRNLLFKFRQWSFVKHILVFYLFITVIGSLLLYMPYAQQSGVSVKYVDALFTSASAFSDTGLATLTTASTWSYFGQAIIAMLILIGGIGWFALKIYLFNILLGRPISYRARETLAGERGSSVLGDTRRIIKVSVTILFVLVILSSITLMTYFYFTEPSDDPFGTATSNDKYVMENPYHNVSASFRFGLFHSISGLNNAGFDIIGDHSLMPYYHKYGLQIIFIILFVIGGIGYPVIYDIYLFIRSKFTKEKFKWSLFTKISMISYVAIVIIGLSITFALEVPKNNGMWSSDRYGSTGDKTMGIIFNTLSTRNAGFASVDMADFSAGTHLIWSIMMFIGSAPSSTAGGIRTTTIAIVILGLWSKIRGKTNVRAFNRRIDPETVSRAYIVMVTAVIIVTVGTLVLMSSWTSYGGEVDDKKHGFDALLFETSSAFGTTGLSTGITGGLSTISKLVLIVIMFIGQLGVSSSLLVWNKKDSKQTKYKYVQEDITIG